MSRTFLAGAIITLVLFGAGVSAATSSTAQPGSVITIRPTDSDLPIIEVIDNSWSPPNNKAGAAAGHIRTNPEECVVIDFGKQIAEARQEPRWQLKFGRNQSVQVGDASDPVLWIHNRIDNPVRLSIDAAEGLPRGMVLELYASGVLVSRVVGNSSSPEDTEIRNRIMPGAYYLPGRGRAPAYLLVKTDGSFDNAGTWEVGLKLGAEVQPPPPFVPSTANDQQPATRVYSLGDVNVWVTSNAAAGTVVVRLTSELPSAVPPPGEGKIIKAFGLEAFDMQGMPRQLALSKPATIVVTYTSDELAAAGGDAGALAIMSYDLGTGQWAELPTTIDAATRTATATTSHLSLFSLMAWPAVVSDVLGSMSGEYKVVWAFDNTKKVWAAYDPAAPSYANSLRVLESGRAYWIEATGNIAVTYGTNTYHLTKGWNLVGWFGRLSAAGSRPIAVSDALDSIAGKYEAVWTFDNTGKTRALYDPAAPAVSDLTVFTKEQGYWICMKEAAILTYGANSYTLNTGWNLIGWLPSP